MKIPHPQFLELPGWGAFDASGTMSEQFERVANTLVSRENHAVERELRKAVADGFRGRVCLRRVIVEDPGATPAFEIEIARCPSGQMPQWRALFDSPNVAVYELDDETYERLAIATAAGATPPPWKVTIE